MAVTTSDRDRLCSVWSMKNHVAFNILFPRIASLRIVRCVVSVLFEIIPRRSRPELVTVRVLDCQCTLLRWHFIYTTHKVFGGNSGSPHSLSENRSYAVAENSWDRKTHFRWRNCSDLRQVSITTVGVTTILLLLNGMNFLEALVCRLVFIRWTW